MKEMDLMYALAELEDDLLLEAETAAAPRKRSLVKLVALAAVVALLAFTVYASHAEARISYPNDENSVLYQSFEVDGIKYSHVKIEYDLQPVEIREHAIWFVSDMVEMVSHWQVEDGELIPFGSGMLSHTFASLDIAENFFGLTFALPESVREGEDKFDVTLLAVPTYPTEELESGAILDDGPELGGAKLFFTMDVNDKRIDMVSVNIYIALSEEFAADPAAHISFAALDLLGEPEIREVKIGDEEFTIVTYADDPGRNVHVYYVRDGIGYGLSFYGNESYQGDALRMIYTHLKEIGS